MRFILACIIFFAPVIGGEQESKCLCTPQAISKMFAAVAKKSTPAVVYIQAEGGESAQMEGSEDLFNHDFFDRFFGHPQRSLPQKQPIAQGSGFFVSSDGYILTNAHVIKNAKKISVSLQGGRKMSAEIIGIDVSTDVGVIKVEGSGFDFLPLGNSKEVEVAEWVIAIGSPFQLEATVTVGIVSAKGRQGLRINDYEDFIQTDASINPGNSGGPLLNLKGEVIGINTAIFSKSGGHMGIGFAIPIDMANYVLKQIIDHGSVDRSYLGIALQPIDQEIADAFKLAKPEGALVAEVVKNSPADKAGLQQGDIIIGYNNVPVTSVGTFRNEISRIRPGTKVVLKINRSGKILKVSVVLSSRSDELEGTGMIKKLGMEIEPLTSEMAGKLGYLQHEEGVVVTKIKPGSPAALAGMRPGFLILAVNHKKVKNLKDFEIALEQSDNNRVLILAKYGNATRFYSIKLP